MLRQYWYALVSEELLLDNYKAQIFYWQLNKINYRAVNFSFKIIKKISWLKLDLFTSSPYIVSTPISILYHPANPCENSFQRESGFWVTSSSNNWCPSGRYPEMSWGQLVWTSERPGSQSKYCRTIQILQTKFCGQGLSKKPFAKMAHIFASKHLGTSSWNKRRRQLDRKGPGMLARQDQWDCVPFMGPFLSAAAKGL